MNEHEIYLFLKWLEKDKGIVLCEKYGFGDGGNYTEELVYTEDEVVSWLHEKPEYS